MSKSQTLRDVLRSVHAEKDTGHVFAIGKHGGSSRLCTIQVKDGEIVGMQRSGDADTEVLDFLLSAEITHVTFTAMPVSVFGGTQDLPSTDSILQRIDSIAEPTRQDSGGIIQDVELEQEALNILEGLFGSAAAEKIKKIAAKHPPTVRPQAFLTSCTKVIEPVFGKAVAERALAHLYRRLE